MAADDALVVPLRVDNLDGFTADTKKASSETEKLMKRMEQLEKQQVKMNRSLSPSRSQRQTRIYGAAQRYEDIRLKATAIQNDSNSTPAQRSDADTALKRAERATQVGMQRAAPEFGKQFTRMLKSTRVEMGSGGGFNVLPLAGQLAELTGPYGIAMGFATTMLQKFGEAMDQSRQRTLAWQEAKYTSGGTPKEVSQLGVMGNILFPGAENAGQEMAKRAQSFADSMAHNGEGMMRFGQYNMPGGFGKLDQAQMFMKAIDKLRGMTEEQATRATRAIGQPDLMRFRDLDPTTWKAVQDASSEAALSHGPQGQAAAAEKAAHDAVSKSYGDSVTRSIERMYNEFMNHLAKINEYVVSHPGATSDEAQKAVGGAQGAAGATGQKGVVGPDNLQTATQKNTVAAMDNTAAMATLAFELSKNTRVIIGGGSRAQSAIPAQLRYQQWTSQMAHMAKHGGVL